MTVVETIHKALNLGGSAPKERLTKSILTVNLDSDIIEWLRTNSHSSGKSTSELTRQLLRICMDAEKRAAAIAAAEESDE